jgi:hypothetical protein
MLPDSDQPERKTNEPTREHHHGFRQTQAKAGDEYGGSSQSGHRVYVGPENTRDFHKKKIADCASSYSRNRTHQNRKERTDVVIQCLRGAGDREEAKAGRVHYCDWKRLLRRGGAKIRRQREIGLPPADATVR